MRRTTYSCDCSGCENRTSDIEYNKWIEIGSTNGMLQIQNHLPNRKLISLANHDDIHFCSEQCLINFFIQKEVKETDKLKSDE